MSFDWSSCPETCLGFQNKSNLALSCCLLWDEFCYRFGDRNQRAEQISFRKIRTINSKSLYSEAKTVRSQQDECNADHKGSHYWSWWDFYIYVFLYIQARVVFFNPPPLKKSIRLKTPSNEGEVLELLTGFQTTLKEYRSKCQNLFAGWQRGEGGAAGKKTALYVKYDVLYCCILQAVRRRMLTRRSPREDGTSLVLWPVNQVTLL